MKKLFVLILVIFAIATAARAEDYLDTIARNVCAETKKFDGTGDIELKLGVIMIKSCEPYRDRILKDYNIDMGKIANDDSNEGQALGRIVGTKMALYCPEFFQQFLTSDDEEDAGDGAQQSVSGMMIAITYYGPFPVIQIETNSNERYNLIILEDFDGAAEFIKNKDKYYKKPLKFIFTYYQLFDKETLTNQSYKVLNGIEE